MTVDTLSGSEYAMSCLRFHVYLELVGAYSSTLTKLSFFYESYNRTYLQKYNERTYTSIP